MTVRISTSAFYAQNTERLLEQQAQIARKQDQISSGVRVEKSSEDPLAFAAAQRAENSLMRINQYERNITFGETFLSEMEVVMEASGETMKQIKEKLIQANGGILSMEDRKIIANDLRGKLNEMISQANQKDTSGNYIFSGTSATTPAFSATTPFGYQGTPSPASGITFQVADGRTMDLSINGSDAYTDYAATGETYFEMVEQAISVLEDPSANLASSFSAIGSKMDRVFDNLQIARGRVGNKLEEMAALKTGFNIVKTELQKVINREVATDLTQTISDLAQADILLQASQKSFANVSKVSLFDYL